MTDESSKPIDEPTLPQDAEPVEENPAVAPEEAVADTPADASPQEAELPADVAAEKVDQEVVEVNDEEPPATDAADQPESEVAEEREGVSEALAEALEQQGASEAPDADATEERKMDWYILKVQSNREDSIRDGLIRRVKIAGLEDCFGDVIVPTEKVTEFKAGKKRVTKRKLYPGYIVVNMEINEDTWFLVRETPGIGDFTGAAGTPTPMLPHEVQRILAKREEKQDEVPKLKIGFRLGDQVKINEGTFENFEGEVSKIDETSGKVEVMINIFGRSTPVELEYWQIESV